MITDIGKLVFLRHLANEGADFAEVMVFGAGDSEPTLSDTKLDYEVHRSEIDLVDYDESTSTVVARAAIPDNLYFQVHEVGLVVGDNRVDGDAASEVITAFSGEDLNEWSGETDIVESGQRIGTSSLELVVAASETGTASRDARFGRYGDMQPQDQFAFAYNVTDGVPDSIEIKFLVDDSNYYSHTFTPSAGFNIERWTKSAMVQTGSADWDGFTGIDIDVNAGGSGTTVLLESLRTDLVRPDDEQLVARTVLTEHINKQGVAEVQVEYRLPVSFNV